jgi:crotonobetainyl-CoA:carnitine CoA-transferase CaiB-like acyl-CoA transferase
VQELFGPTSICWHPYQTVDELARPGGLIESSAIFERVHHHGVGEIWTAGPMFRLEGETRLPLKPTPDAAQRETIADLAATDEERSRR